MKFLPVFAVFLAAGAVHAFAAAADGKPVYDAKCKMCHMADGSGNPGIAKAMKVTMKPLGSAEVQAKSDAELKKIIKDGTGKMRPVAGLSAKQVDEVVAYVRTLKK
jgi:cytochrome c6